MHVLLTGASSGIGASLAKALSADRHVLTLVARREQKLAEVAEACAGEAHVLPADLTDPVVVEGLVERAEALGGPVDVLVNNAGIEYIGATAQMDPDLGERLLRLNTLTPLRLTRGVLPGMLARGRGHIIDVASAAAFVAPPFGTHYAASKAALAAAGHQLRWELRETPVKVLTVYPGPVSTEMGTRVLDHYTFDPSKGLPWGTADELAQRILTAMRRGDGELFYPRFYALSRTFARAARWIMRHQDVRLADPDA